MAINHPYEIPGVTAVFHAVNAASDIDLIVDDVPDCVEVWRRMRNPDDPGDTDTQYDLVGWLGTTPPYRPVYKEDAINGLSSVYWRSGGRLRSNAVFVTPPCTIIFAGIMRDAGGSHGAFSGGSSTQKMTFYRTGDNRWEFWANGGAESGYVEDAFADTNIFTILGGTWDGASSWCRRNLEDPITFDGTGALGLGAGSLGIGSGSMTVMNGWVGELSTFISIDRAITAQEYEDIYAWIRKEWGFVDTPYPGEHTVTSIDNATDPNCIYFGQGVDIGDTFSFKETSEINGWGVSIDADGYPIIDSGGAEGTDSFLFDIDKGAGYENPSEWTFTIGGGGVGSNVIGGAFQAIGAGSNVIGGSFRTLGAPSAPTYPDRRVTIDRPYTADLSAGWKFSDGSDFTIDALPTGLTMSTAGIVTGTPTVLSEVTVSTVSHMGITSNAFTWTVVTRPPSGTLADAKFDALRDQGFTGTISDMTLQWLQANGATSGSITDAWLEVLPGTGQRNDRWYTVLGGMGYTGSLNDREFAFWVDGGLLPGTVDVGPANLEAFLISEGWGVTRTGESFVVRSGVHEWWFTWSEAEAGVYEQDLPAPLRNDIDDSFGR